MADSAPDTIVAPRQLKLVDFFKRLIREKPLGAVGMLISLSFLFVAVFADFIAPYPMNEIHLGENLLRPSAKYWLGTDNLGRDMLSQIMFGARVSVIVGLAGASIATLLTLFLGMLSGYLGGRFDMVVQRVVDGVMSMPGLVLVMAAVSMVGASLWSVIVVLGILGGIGGSRIIRSAVIDIKENAYVESSRAIGTSTMTIIFRHILPNIMAPAIVNFSLQVPSLILTEASLSFLGYGVPPPQPSWGGMLGIIGRLYMFKAPWMALWPGVALAAVVFGINVLGDALRDLLDPRLRGGTGNFRVTHRRR
ncbi:MAG: ABC transporter permease [Spirochaetaceae bacterium]|nr:ABC transporter permease [Spirochaetaceae bacterium]